MDVDDVMSRVDALVAAALEAHEMRNQVRSALEALAHGREASDVVRRDSDINTAAVLRSAGGNTGAGPTVPAEQPAGDNRIPPEILAELLRQGKQCQEAVESGFPMRVAGLWAPAGEPVVEAPPTDNPISTEVKDEAQPTSASREERNDH